MGRDRRKCLALWVLVCVSYCLIELRHRIRFTTWKYCGDCEPCQEDLRRPSSSDLSGCVMDRRIDSEDGAPLGDSSQEMSSHINTTDEMCPSESPFLLGEIPLNKSHTPISDFEHTLLEFVRPGGAAFPRNCVANHRVAIIVPFRDRHEHLAVLLRHLHPVLHRQQLDYRIFVVEQTPTSKFNKGLLFNAGFLEISNRFPGIFQCVVLQDVDILPLNDKISYKCTDRPHHLSVYIDRYRFKPFLRASGGVLELLVEHFRKVNGFSNLYFGWGGEDDDFQCRLISKQLNWTQNNTPWEKWASLNHKHGMENPIRYDLTKTCRQRQDTDGLSTARYVVTDYREMSLYTNISVEVQNVVYNGTTYN